MKQVLVFIALSLGLYSTSLFAKSNESNVGVNVEAGANGNYGLLGLEGAYMPSQRFDIHGGAGIGAAATLRGAGARIYTNPSECFWLKHCSEKYFIGATLSQTVTSEVTETGDDKVQRKYKIPRTNFVNATVGDSTVFFDRLNFMLNIGYKFALQKNSPELVSGASDETTSQEINSALQSGPQVSVTAGFLF